MSLFGELRHDPLAPVQPTGRPRPFAPIEEAPGAPPVSLYAEESVGLTSADLSDQFFVFQFGGTEEQPRVLEANDVTPSVEGSDDEPDVHVRMQMMSFHVGRRDAINSDSRATMRLDIGKDENSSSHLDTLFWSVAAGLKLYDESKKKSAEPRELKTDVSSAFVNRPIEIPGGLARLSFEVVKHREPPWWKKVFRFLTSDTGAALTSAVGFPGITTQAIGFIDELVDRLSSSEPEVLFKSRPMPLALTQKARSEVIGGVPGVTVGALSPGYMLLARGRDFPKIVETNPRYPIHLGILVPDGVTNQDVMAGAYDDPYEDMSYAIFRVAMKQTSVDMIPWGA